MRFRLGTGRMPHPVLIMRKEIFLKHARFWREVRVCCLLAVFKMTDQDRHKECTSSPGKDMDFCYLIINKTRFTQFYH